MAPSGPPTWLFGGGSRAKDGKKSNPTVGEKTKEIKKAKEAKVFKEADEVKKSGKAAPITKKQMPVVQSPLPAQLLDMMDEFLAENAFEKAHRAFQKQRRQSEAGDNATTSGKPDETLLSIYRFWEAAQINASRKSEVAAKAGKTGTVSDGDSSDSSSSSSSSASSGSSSSSSSEDESRQRDSKKAKANLRTSGVSSSRLKRKAPSNSSTSDSLSDSDSSSSATSNHSDEAPRSKKQKTASTGQPSAAPDHANRMDVDGSCTSDSESSSDSDSSTTNKKPNLSSGCDNSSTSEGSSSSESESSSSSDSESSIDSGVLTEVQMAGRVPLPGSNSSSTSSDSGSEDDRAKAAPKLTNKLVKTAGVCADSDSSATLGNKSPERKAASSADPSLPPDPVKAGRTKQGSKERFSRIPKDIMVDDRFASNDYVTMDYSKRAWEDLVVTKGKGFTKGKNKMKKGGFRGGAIDINQKGGVVFFDD